MPFFQVNLGETKPLTVFCDENEVPYTQVFRLSWAFVLHRFFSTDAFLVSIENEKLGNKQPSIDNISRRALVSRYESELAKTTATVKALRSRQREPPHGAVCCQEILPDVDYEEFDKSGTKCWTILNFGPASDAEYLMKIEEVRSSYPSTSYC